MFQYEITNDANQSFVIPYEDSNIEVTLEFLTIPSCWIMDLVYEDNIIIQGLRLNSALLSLDTFNLPFDFFIEDVNDLGLDPFDINNFIDGLYTFNLITRDELNTIRGYEVE